MSHINWIDCVGYAASVFLILSMAIKNDLRKIRFMNMLGCLCFIIYGYFIDSIPIIIPNVIIFCIQIYYLYIVKLIPSKSKTN